MRIELEKIISKEQRKFLLILIGASLTLWNICFEIGAWGQLFYHHFFLYLDFVTGVRR